MKTIIAGTRTIKDLYLIDDAIHESGFKITEIVSGKAPGADSLGEEWAEANGIPVKPFPANWDDLTATNALIRRNRFGKLYNARAGFDRNQKMAEYADVLIAIWDGKSSGTKDMIDRATKAGLKIYIKYVIIKDGKLRAISSR